MLRRDPAAVVLDLEHQFAPGGTQPDIDARSLGVADHVGQRLLHDPEQGHREGQIQRDVGRRQGRHAGQAGPFLEIRRQPLDRRHQAQVVQYAGPHRRRNRLGGFDQALRARHHGGDLVAQTGQIGGARGLQPAVQPREVDLQRGQPLPQFVVQFPGEAGALLLADVLDAGRQRAHPLMGDAQFLLRLFPIGGITCDGDVAIDRAARVS